MPIIRKGLFVLRMFTYAPIYILCVEYGKLVNKKCALRYNQLLSSRQKMKRCSTFLVYNDVCYRIPFFIIFLNGKVNKQTEMTDAPSGDKSREGDI